MIRSSSNLYLVERNLYIRQQSIVYQSRVWRWSEFINWDSGHFFMHDRSSSITIYSIWRTIMKESLENQIIQLLTDILAVRTLDEDLARRCLNMIMSLVTGENAIPHSVTPANNNNHTVRLAAYDQLISPVPDGEYIACLTEASSRINKENIVTVKLSFKVKEGSHSGDYMLYVMTLNNIGMNKYYELLHSFCGDDGLDECYSFIQNNKDPSTSFSRVLERFYGIPKKVSWRNKKGYKGFNDLKILA